MAVYLAGVVGLSVFVGRGQTDEVDYYVGGRSLPWWAVGISTMATQTSVISFISIPAFVAIKEGGGLTWLQYELSVPLAMIMVMVVLLPFFRKLELISVYEYLEMRFSPRVRLLISGIFLLSRGFGTGVAVYGTALVLKVCTGLPIWAIILLVGVLTTVYDTIGGMKAVVWSDVVQMAVLFFGLLLCIYYAADMGGGFFTSLEQVPRERLHALDWSSGFTGDETSFWAFLLGGFFLYTSYYGADQSQTQRELSAPTMADTKRSLVFNGLARFPLTCLYLLLGLTLSAAFANSSMLQEAVAGGRPDDLVPTFVVEVIPMGIRAIIIAAMLAAAMSSLDSSLNSLSASTMRDFIHRDRPMSTDRVLLLSKVTTLVWGAIMTGFAFLVGNIADTVIEAVNKIGSAFYGPILAAFVIGVLSRRATAVGVVLGVLAGVGLNVILWLFVPGVHFLWWNMLGFVATVFVSSIWTLGGARPSPEVIEKYTISRAAMWREERPWIPTYLVLVAAFVVILGIGLLLNHLAG